MDARRHGEAARYEQGTGQGTGAVCATVRGKEHAARAAGIGERYTSDGRSAAARGPNSACAGGQPCGDRPTKARLRE